MTEPIRLLYVADETGRVDREVRSLADDQFSVERVGDPSTVPARLENDSVDCVLAGHDRPDLDGLALLETVSETAPDVPVVLYSREATDGFVEEAFSAGVADVVHGTPDADLTPLVAARIRTAVEQAARSGEFELYRSSLQAARDGIAVLAADGEFLLANPSFAEYLGLPPADIVGETFGESPTISEAVENPPDLVDMYAEAYEEARDGGHSEFRYESIAEMDGEPRVINNRVSAVQQGDGSIIYILVGRDITERKAQERELARKNERLEEFANVVSHDLRNPLNVAQGYLEEARRAGDGEYFERVADAHDRMAELIDDLLTLAREGRTVEDVERVSLPELCERCWAQVDTADASLSVETSAEVPADPGRLRQLLANLFRNAIEHGESDVAVTVGASEDVFYVEDDGPGIAPDEREQVFESGYSTDSAGSGLGLSIVRQIADAHGWTVAAREGTDGGARIAVADVDLVE